MSGLCEAQWCHQGLRLFLTFYSASLNIVTFLCVSCSVVSDSVTPQTEAYQASLSMGFSGKNSGVGCHSLLQEIFPTQGLNLGLLHCRQIVYHLSHQRSSPVTFSLVVFAAPRGLCLCPKQGENKVQRTKIFSYVALHFAGAGKPSSGYSAWSHRLESPPSPQQ